MEEDSTVRTSARTWPEEELHGPRAIGEGRRLSGRLGAPVQRRAGHSGVDVLGGLAFGCLLAAFPCASRRRQGRPDCRRRPRQNRSPRPRRSLAPGRGGNRPPAPSRTPRRTGSHRSGLRSRFDPWIYVNFKGSDLVVVIRSLGCCSPALRGTMPPVAGRVGAVNLVAGPASARLILSDRETEVRRRLTHRAD